MFKTGREPLKDKPHSGRPYTSINEQNVTQLRDFELNDRRLTIRNIIDHLPILLEFLGPNTVLIIFVSSWFLIVTQS